MQCNYGVLGLNDSIDLKVRKRLVEISLTRKDIYVKSK